MDAEFKGLDMSKCIAIIIALIAEQEHAKITYILEYIEEETV